MSSNAVIWRNSHVTLVPPNGWKCGWCQKTWSGRAANRVIAHLSRMKLHEKNGIEFCSAVITNDKLQYYQRLATQSNNKRDRKFFYKQNRFKENHIEHSNLASERMSKKPQKKRLY